MATLSYFIKKYRSTCLEKHDLNRSQHYGRKQHTQQQVR